MSIESIKYSCWDILNGEVDTSLPAGWWVSQDKQGSYDMRGGTVASALVELLGQCVSGEQRDGILTGTISVAEEAGEVPSAEKHEADVAKLKEISLSLSLSLFDEEEEEEEEDDLT